MIEYQGNIYTPILSARVSKLEGEEPEFHGQVTRSGIAYPSTGDEMMYNTKIPHSTIPSYRNARASIGHQQNVQENRSE